jgi:SAM-dependent methyltransferase
VRRHLKKLHPRIRRFLRISRDLAVRTWYRGSSKFCPICEKEARRFLPFGDPPRDEARCLHCGGLERHRLTWIFLQRRTSIFSSNPGRILHVAPEACFEPRFKAWIGSGYVTADLEAPHVMERMDITDIHHPDESFDGIICSHVLEHVQDDKAAIQEFYRVLAIGGWAILLVPISAERTFEDPSVVDPKERRRLFGQDNHVRRYGPDYVDRLREAGFQVEVTSVSELADDAEVSRMGLAPGEQIFLGRRN